MYVICIFLRFVKIGNKYGPSHLLTVVWDISRCHGVQIHIFRNYFPAKLSLRQGVLKEHFTIKHPLRKDLSYLLLPRFQLFMVVPFFLALLLQYFLFNPLLFFLSFLSQSVLFPHAYVIYKLQQLQVSFCKYRFHLIYRILVKNNNFMKDTMQLV